MRHQSVRQKRDVSCREESINFPHLSAKSDGPGPIFVLNAIPYWRCPRADVTGQHKDFLALVAAEVVRRHSELVDSRGESRRGTDWANFPRMALGQQKLRSPISCIWSK